jgi:bifunctional non-homologous end joining protein LigD
MARGRAQSPPTRHKDRLARFRLVDKHDDANTRRLLSELHAIERHPDGGEIHVGGHTFLEKHPSKVLWPELGVTKADLMRYYIRMAPVLLPYLRDRPLSFRRFEAGIAGKSQFHQRMKFPTPPGVRTAAFTAEGKTFEPRLIAGDLMTLLYCVHVDIISQDVWLSRVNHPDQPDYAVFDLDPQPSVPFRQVVDVACWLREVLDQYGVLHGVKTSGMSGLHIYVPIIHTDYPTARAFVRQFASYVARRHPGLATVARMIHDRGRRVYIDPDQNMRAKTMAAPYSARHSAFAGVSAPVTWQELDDGAQPQDFTILTMRDRLSTVGELWNSLSRRPLDLGKLIQSAA